MDIDDLRQYLNSGRYELTLHAKGEAANDQLFDYDLGAIARSGEIIATSDPDWRGTEYLVEGRTADGRTARMKLAVTEKDLLRITTVYVRRRKRR